MLWSMSLWSSETFSSMGSFFPAMLMPPARVDVIHPQLVGGTEVRLLEHRVRTVIGRAAPMTILS